MKKKLKKIKLKFSILIVCTVKMTYAKKKFIHICSVCECHFA